MLEEPKMRRPHPDGIRDVVRRGSGEIGSAGVAEVAEPLLPRAHLTLQDLPDVVADDLGAPAGVAQHLAASGGVGQRDVVVLEPADQGPRTGPLARAATIEPDAARMCGGDLGEEVLDAHRPPGLPKKFATIAAPCSESTDSGWNWTPSSGSSR